MGRDQNGLLEMHTLDGKEYHPLDEHPNGYPTILVRRRIDEDRLTNRSRTPRGFSDKAGGGEKVGLGLY